jgi:hypothetical protein
MDHEGVEVEYNHDEDESYTEEEIEDVTESEYDEETVQTEEFLPQGASPFAPRGGRRPQPSPLLADPAEEELVVEEEEVVLEEELVVVEDSPVPSRPVHPLFGGAGAKNELAAAAQMRQKSQAEAPSPEPAAAAAAVRPPHPLLGGGGGGAPTRPPHPLFGGGGGGGGGGGLNDQIKAMAAKRNERVAASGGVAAPPPKKSIDSVMPTQSRAGGNTNTASMAEQVAMLAAKRRARMDGGESPVITEPISPVVSRSTFTAPTLRKVNRSPPSYAKAAPAFATKPLRAVKSSTSAPVPAAPPPAPVFPTAYTSEPKVTKTVTQSAAGGEAPAKTTTLKKRIVRKKIIRKSDGTKKEIVTIVTPEGEELEQTITITTPDGVETQTKTILNSAPVVDAAASPAPQTERAPAAAPAPPKVAAPVMTRSVAAAPPSQAGRSLPQQAFLGPATYAPVLDVSPCLVISLSLRYSRRQRLRLYHSLSKRASERHGASLVMRGSPCVSLLQCRWCAGFCRIIRGRPGGTDVPRL